MMPVGIQGGNEFHERLAPNLHLGVFPEGRQSPARPASGEKAGHETLVVDKPVRSGQQIYARGRDLIVLAPVGPGAEVISDGNIHVYAALRGRALAGVMGNESARIFCRELRAELVSVTITATAHWVIVWTGLGQQGTIEMDLTAQVHTKVVEVSTVNIPNNKHGTTTDRKSVV